MAKTSELTLNVRGLQCASCVSSVERGVSSLAGVTACRVNLAVGSAVVEFDRSLLTEEHIIGKIRELGFDAAPGTPDVLLANQQTEDSARRLFRLSLLASVPLMVLAMWPMFAGDFLFSSFIDSILQVVLAAFVMFFPGLKIFKDAALQTKHLRANMNTLISIGTLAAFGWSIFAIVRIWSGHDEDLYLDSAGMIITLILLGRYLEAGARRKAGGAIEELLRLRPTTTTAIINGVEIEIEAAAARSGMHLLIKPGERVAADGEIIEGTPTIDESVLTGESIPVDKRPGLQVIGGSLNGNTPFTMKVTATGKDSFLANIIRLVGDAQSKKAPVQSLADRVAGVFAPTVLGIALVTGLCWFFLAPDNPMMIRSVIAVLIVACPCALGLATPTAVLAGTGRGAREGIIVKGGDILESVSSIDTVVFDKTGTLTQGALDVVSIQTGGQIPEHNLVRMVGSAEIQSEHPVGQALKRHMFERQISPAVVKNVESRPGYGLLADCDGRRLIVGNQSMMEQEGVSFGPLLLKSKREMEQGKTVVFAALDGQVVGMISLADRVRGDARELIAELQGRMARVTMISGDNRTTAAGVARSLGLDDFEAEIKPHQKQLIVESYRRAGFKVAMVGDGVNDAPALAAATIGIAIGSGTDVAMEAADVVLVRSELSAVSKLFRLSEISLKIIRQNLFWAFAYNVVAIPIAAGLFYPVTGLTLSPIIAAMAMSLSSVFVVTNSLRLSRIDL